MIFYRYLFENIFFYWAPKCLGGIPIRHTALTFWIRILKPGLRLRKSGSEENIHGSATLLKTLVKYVPFAFRQEVAQQLEAEA